MNERPNERAATEDFEFAALEVALRYRQALIREFLPWLRGEVLEVGAGVGQLTAHLQEVPTVRRLVALEPDLRFSRVFRDRRPGVEFRAETAQGSAAGEAWDTIVSVNVLEHIGEDAAELAHYRRLLRRRRGHLCLFVPARPELYAPIDRDFGHHRRYTRPGLRHRLEEAGFDPVRLHYFNLAGYVAWGVTFVALRRRAFHPPSVRFFDRWIFPWAHALERALVRPPVGQSLLAVARARGSPGDAIDACSGCGGW